MPNSVAVNATEAVLQTAKIKNEFKTKVAA